MFQFLIDRIGVLSPDFNSFDIERVTKKISNEYKSRLPAQNYFIKAHVQMSDS